MKRTVVVGVVVLVLALLLAVGGAVLLFSDGLDEEAAPAAVQQDALDDTGFEYENSDVVRIDRTVSAAGVEREIRATNHLTVYQRSADLQTTERQAGAFVLVTTPEFAVVGRPMNPVTDMSNRDLLEEFRGDLEAELEGDLGNLREVDERTEPVLGVAGTVTTFAANTTVDGEEIVLNVHVTKVRHDGDVVIAIGAHPEALQQQAPEVFGMMTGIDHPGEP